MLPCLPWAEAAIAVELSQLFYDAIDKKKEAERDPFSFEETRARTNTVFAQAAVDNRYEKHLVAVYTLRELVKIREVRDIVFAKDRFLRDAYESAEGEFLDNRRRKSVQRDICDAAVSMYARTGRHAPAALSS